MAPCEQNTVDRAVNLYMYLSMDKSILFFSGNIAFDISCKLSLGNTNVSEKDFKMLSAEIFTKHPQIKQTNKHIGKH